MATTALTLLLALVLSSGCSTESTERGHAFETLARWEDQRFAPEDSLLAMIQAKDAHVRLRALRSAGLMGQRSIIPAMIEALSDPSETVARQAAFSLGLLGDQTATKALEAILENSESELQLAAARGLAHLPNEGQALLVATGSDNPAVTAAAWDALRNISDQADSTQLVAAMVTGLEENTADVLWRVLRCAERLPAPELVPHLASHVSSNIIQVRVHAYRALARQNNLAALNAVLLGVQNEKRTSQQQHQRTLIAACRALGSLGFQAFNPEGSFSKEECNILTETLISAAGQQNTHLAATALAAMEKLTDTFELPPEAARQESLLPVWRIRLGRSAHSHMSDESPVVRAAAIRSWAALRGSGSTDQLRHMLAQSPTPHDVEAILFALARVAQDPLEVLADFAGNDHQVPVRVAALEGLHHLGTRLDHSEDRELILDNLTRAAADADFVIAATAIGYLSGYPHRLSLVAMSEAWDTVYPEGEAEIKRAILSTLETQGSAVVELKRSGLPEGLEDHLLAIIADMLRQGFDSSDLRIRLESRTTAQATNLLPNNLIPSEESLRATMTPFLRSPNQPPVRTAFDAPKVRCITDRGTFVIRLDGNNAPNTCAMFTDLIQRGFYDDLTFHRVVPDFVVQGGDPRGDGWGGPGYTIRSEWNRSRYERAAVGIAHDGKDTGGSQFFVTLSEQPHLNGRYTVFGEVVKGMEIVDLVQQGDHFRLEILP